MQTFGCKKHFLLSMTQLQRRCKQARGLTPFPKTPTTTTFFLSPTFLTSQTTDSIHTKTSEEKDDGPKNPPTEAKRTTGLQGPEFIVTQAGTERRKTTTVTTTNV